MKFLFSFLVTILYASSLVLISQEIPLRESESYSISYEKSLPRFKQYIDDLKKDSDNTENGEDSRDQLSFDILEKILKSEVAKKKKDFYILLGDLYLLQYRFSEADKLYSQYEKSVKNRDRKEASSLLSPKRAYLKKIKMMVDRAEDIQIIDSVIVAKRDFLDAYNLKSSQGVLSYGSNEKPDSTYTNFAQSQVNTSFYSKSDGASLDIYRNIRFSEDLSFEEKLPEAVNSIGREAYPFLLTDGTTFYFASDNKGSIGGYDLFITSYNFKNGTYLKPRQLNMPFNSPFNDYLLVVDESKGLGWFATDRYMLNDSICVYTFIPNENLLLVDEEMFDERVQRAKISSISMTLKDGVDYDSLRSKAKLRNQDMPENEDMLLAEFTFMIKDNVIYHYLADFKNNAAQLRFKELTDVIRKSETIKDDLKSLRLKYESKSPNDRGHIVAEIKDKEALLLELYSKISFLEKSVRELETQIK